MYSAESSGSDFGPESSGVLLWLAPRVSVNTYDLLHMDARGLICRVNRRRLLLLIGCVLIPVAWLMWPKGEPPQTVRM